MRRPSLGTHHLRLPNAGPGNGLIVLHDGRRGAVGKAQVHHNLYATSTKRLEGEPLIVVSHKVDLRGRTLRWLIERLDKRHTYYLSGEMMVGSKLDQIEDLVLYRSADFDGNVRTMPGRRSSPLCPTWVWWRRRERCVCTVWLRAGEAAVEVSLSDKRSEEAIPQVQKAHL